MARITQSLYAAANFTRIVSSNTYYVSQQQIATLLRILFDVTVERVETVIFNPTFKVSTRSTDTENQFFKRGAIKNIMFHVVILCMPPTPLLFATFSHEATIWILFAVQYYYKLLFQENGIKNTFPNKIFFSCNSIIIVYYVPRCIMRVITRRATMLA